MQTANAELMRSARESLRGKWGLAIAVGLVFMIVTGIVGNIDKRVGPLLNLLVAGPLAGGLAMFYLSIARGTEAKFEQLFDGFKVYATYLVAYLLILVYVFLWALLLIVPGIIAAISYSMTYFIIADEPTIAASDALKRSKEMMRGNKWKFFRLQLRFLGWALLAILSLGIGFLWLLPYIQTSVAKFYDDLKNGSGQGWVSDGDRKEADDSKPEAVESKSEDVPTGPFAAETPSSFASEETPESSGDGKENE